MAVTDEEVEAARKLLNVARDAAHNAASKFKVGEVADSYVGREGPKYGVW